MSARAGSLPSIAVNIAELIVYYRQFSPPRPPGAELVLLLVLLGSAPMLEQVGLGCSGGARLIEAFLGDQTKLAE